MMANDKSKAEQYRDERKARIAETAKKNAKNMEKKNTAKKLAGRIISIVLAAAIVLAALGLTLNYYGAIERVTPLGKVGSEQSVSVAEYEYYYMQTYNRLVNYAQYYSSYGYDYGYDTTLSPADQTKTTTDADGNEITWVQKLHDDTIQLAQMYKSYYNEAVKEGLELTKADEATIDEQVKTYQEQANGTSDTDTTDSSQSTPKKYSLNAYLRKIFGGAVNERFLRKQLKIQTLAQKYYQTRTDKIAAGYSQDVIDKVYNEDKDTYDLVTFRIYTFENSQLTAEDGESDDALKTRQEKSDAETKTKADEFYAAVKDEKTFADKATEINKGNDGYNADKSTKFTALKAGITQNYSEEIANWLYNASTKVGDKKLVSDTENGKYYIILLVEGKHQADTVTARHILFMTKDQSSGEALSADKIKEAKQNAENALKTWQEGDKTEESFAALASELTEDTGSTSTGGLYKNIYPGQMMGEFEDWCFNADRKTGDVEIIETDAGYHVMYFVKKDGKPYYDSAIRTSKSSEDIETEATKMLDGDDYKVGFGPRRLKYAEKRITKKINTLVELNNANSASSSSANYAS